MLDDGNVRAVAAAALAHSGRLAARTAATVRRPVRIAAFAASTAAMMATLEAHQRATPGSRAAEALVDVYMRRWARLQLALFGVRPKVHGHVSRTDQGRLVVANHRSAIDIGLCAWLFGGSIVSRDDLSSWPLVGPAARKARTIFVARDDPQSGARVIRDIRRHVSRGHTVTVFPEGTTFRGDEVRPFHPGAFAAVARTGKLIVPVGIAYDGDDACYFDETFGRHLLRVAARSRTRVAVHIGHPIVADASLNAAALAERTRAAVQAQVIDARLGLLHA